MYVFYVYTKLYYILEFCTYTGYLFIIYDNYDNFYFPKFKIRHKNKIERCEFFSNQSVVYMFHNKISISAVQ